jgi:CubicO group peptidase (beta-lactamase class C family)
MSVAELKALEMIDGWGASMAAAAVIDTAGATQTRGPIDTVRRLASVTKLLTAYATLIAIEEGVIALNHPAGRPGATVEHLLAHAAGYGFNGAKPIAPVGRRRIYSNTGIEVLAAHLETASGIPFAEYLRAAVLEPLGMASTDLRGSPAHQAFGTVVDLLAFVREIFAPKLIHSSTLADAMRVHFPGLAGVLPGFGRHDPMDWGLGFEVKGTKHPHWSGTLTSAQTVGHFGGTGTFLWVDPTRSLAVVCITDRPFGPWAAEAWPAFNDAIIREAAA